MTCRGIDQRVSEELVPDKPIPEQDPITSKSYAAHYVIATIILIITLFWALWDEAWGQRPWKAFQEQWKTRYSAFLNTARTKSQDSEKDVEKDPEYAELCGRREESQRRLRRRRESMPARNSTMPAPACSRSRAYSPIAALTSTL